MKKSLSILVIVALIFSIFPITVSAESKSIYKVEHLFDFYSQKETSSQYSNSFSTEQQNSAPISTILHSQQSPAERYIVKTKKRLSVEEQKKLLDKLGVYSKNFDSIIGFTAYIPEENIDELKKNPLVTQVYKDSIVVGLGNTTSIALSSISVPQVVKEKNVDGKGIGVAILDTGVFPHDDLIQPNDRIVAFKDFVNNKVFAYDDSGHGTHIAGIIAGNGYYSSEYKGVAPKVNLIIGKVLDSNERGNLSTVIEGIDWVIENKDKYNIRVLNLSLGTSFTSDNDPLIEAVNKAWDAGIVVVTAAGNGGEHAQVMSPAASKKVIAVGATNTMNTVSPHDDQIAWFSVRPQTINGVNKPDIYAPGQNIVSLLSPGSNYYKSRSDQIVDSLYFKSSGTSMAAPFVAGSIALMLNNNPNLKPDQVKKMIMENAIINGDFSIFNLAKSIGLNPNFEEENLPYNPDIDMEEETNPIPVPNQNENTIPSDGDNNETVYEEEQDKYPTYEGIPPSDIPTEDNHAINDENPVFPIANEDDHSFYIPNANGQNNYVPEQTPSFPDTRPEANIPNMPNYQYNQGYKFVKDTYSIKDVLKNMLPNKDQYINGEEIQDQYENISDIIKLFNLINRAFTKEDFLYFEERLKN